MRSFRYFLMALLACWATGCRIGASLEESNPTEAHTLPEAADAIDGEQISRIPAVANHQPAGNEVQFAAHLEPEALQEDSPLIAPQATLDQLVAIALANNPEIQAAQWQASALEQRVPQVRSLENPTLMTTTFLNSIQTAAGPQDVIMSLTQKVPWFGKRRLRGEVAWQDAQAAFAQKASVDLDIIEQVKLAYYELYFLDRAIEVNEELGKRLETVIEIAKTKFETAEEKTGLETVLQARVELSQLQAMLVELEQAKVKAKARLAKALFLPVGETPDIKPAIAGTKLPQSSDILLGLIEQCQPKLQSLRQELNRDQAAVALAQRNYYPDLTVGFNWHAVGSTGLSPIATGNDAYSLLLGVDLPVYRQRLHAGVREAQFKAARTSEKYNAVWADTRADVQALHAQAIEHDRIVEILDEDILPRAKQTVDLSIEAYRVDRITFQQLIENYKTLLRHRIQYHRRLAQREQTLATLERAVGCAIATWSTEFEELPAASPEGPPQADRSPTGAVPEFIFKNSQPVENKR